MKTVMVNPVSDLLVKEVETDGFSWGALLLGVIWYAIYGVWGKFWLYSFLSILVSCLSAGIVLPVMWVVMGFRFNKEHFEHLLSKGWKVQTKK